VAFWGKTEEVLVRAFQSKDREVSNTVIRNWVMKGPSWIDGVLKHLESAIANLYKDTSLAAICRLLPENGVSTKYITGRNNNCNNTNYAWPGRRMVTRMIRIGVALKHACKS